MFRGNTVRNVGGTRGQSVLVPLALECSRTATSDAALQIVAALCDRSIPISANDLTDHGRRNQVPVPWSQTPPEPVGGLHLKSGRRKRCHRFPRLLRLILKGL